MNLNLEPEVSKHLELGYCTPEQWEDYWWTERAMALWETERLRKEIAALEDYAKRCSARLKKSVVVRAVIWRG